MMTKDQQELHKVVEHAKVLMPHMHNVAAAAREVVSVYKSGEDGPVFKYVLDKLVLAVEGLDSIT